MWNLWLFLTDVSKLSKKGKCRFVGRSSLKTVYRTVYDAYCVYVECHIEQNESVFRSE